MKPKAELPPGWEKLRVRVTPVRQDGTFDYWAVCKNGKITYRQRQHNVDGEEGKVIAERGTLPQVREDAKQLLRQIDEQARIARSPQQSPKGAPPRAP